MKVFLRIVMGVIIAFFAILLLSSRFQKDRDIHSLWIQCKLEGQLPYDIFHTAIRGFNQIEKIKKKNIISIIDFSMPSTEKRFYVIDLNGKQLIYKCFVAHGKNTGENTADSFSNTTGSLKSSLGFFVTAETYTGDNGYSMKLDGLEKGINDSARLREIVIHGADYVSQDFINKEGRLGRSWGCPALPIELSKEIIDKISDGSCLFIYAKDKYYLENSVYSNPKGIR
jgi:hypothetical protein